MHGRTTVRARERERAPMTSTFELSPSRNGVHDTPRLELYFLSSFRAIRAGAPITSHLTGKPRQFLKLLGANGRRHVPKDALIEMLWPEGHPGAGATSLKVVAHKLRTALEPEKETGEAGIWIEAAHGTYRLNPEAPVWIDVDVFRNHWRRGCVLQAEGRYAEARAEFAQAEELYAGDYLEEDLYEDWTIIPREQLKDIHLDVLQRLAELAERDDDHADVIRYCHKIVLADPCREDGYRMLMRSHGALNQLARAGAWYAVCRQTLAREVGMPPNAETIETFESLFQTAPPPERPPLARGIRQTSISLTSV
jgi:DNA-binding SARP family transcriptional activator